ncbi:sugar phosphate nucleotidyltransferase [Alicyclobacillus tolerans]|uniref:Mannose-1-phosphate guanylyltransferase n=1 Tax=Alicyclobacillus tolerans TaxID=90970 RepID=A0ABT9LV46_9BACL|nr:sugar phosphate nucleotidyltransferase [Alicyclobacillus tengchongensis]MDP9728061.1 mannose-1-phosphate guanylyltransferase [Alicyclobacillus tengchongensis]
MKIILLSGGSGKRLWPMSNEARSKQFLKVLPDKETGQPVSMLQRVWKQLEDVGMQNNAYVCASKAQWELVQSQLGEISFIQEPARRDTFPAISLAALYLLDREGISPDEVVAVVPVDHFVENHYFQQIVRLEQVLQESSADMVLMGVVPEEPTSKFGYIVPGESTDGIAWVEQFVEKPSSDIAQKLMDRGALWNCGVFAFRLSFLRHWLSSRGYQATYQGLRGQFLELPKRSFDYEVVEKTGKIAVLPYRGVWKDLGTWASLSEEMSQPLLGSGVLKDCQETHVLNELGIPVVALGVQGMMIAATPDGILVADKEASAHLKDVVEPFQGRPMYEERRWGSYRVLDYQKLEEGEVLTKWIEISPGCNLSYQKHFHRTETWTILEGHGEVALDNRIFPIGAGDVVRVYAEQWHAIRALDRLKLVEVQRGSELIEEDILRRYMEWREIVEACSLGRESSIAVSTSVL